MMKMKILKTKLSRIWSRIRINRSRCQRTRQKRNRSATHSSSTRNRSIRRRTKASWRARRKTIRARPRTARMKRYRNLIAWVTPKQVMATKESALCRNLSANRTMPKHRISASRKRRKQWRSYSDTINSSSKVLAGTACRLSKTRQERSRRSSLNSQINASGHRINNSCCSNQRCSWASLKRHLGKNSKMH